MLEIVDRMYRRCMRSRHLVLRLVVLVYAVITFLALYNFMKQKPDVVADSFDDAQLSELVTPGPSGYTLSDLLRQWPANKAKAFIYVLLKPDDIDWALTVAENVYAMFNKRHNYPFVVLSDSADIARLLRSAIEAKRENASLLGQVFAYDISRFWQVPNFILERHNRSMQEFTKHSLKSILQSGCESPGNLNYWLMCRFQAKQLTEIPFVRHFEYAWRLDIDSSLCGEISFDIIAYMKENDYWQGFVSILEYDQCAAMLTEHVYSFTKKYEIVPAQGKYYIADASNEYIYNNFEIFKISFYQGEQYQLFINYIDQSGGFFYYRWGDAPVRTVATRLFMPRFKMKHFEPGEVYYRHQAFDSCPSAPAAPTIATTNRSYWK